MYYLGNVYKMYYKEIDGFQAYLLLISFSVLLKTKGLGVPSKPHTFNIGHFSLFVAVILVFFRFKCIAFV